MSVDETKYVLSHLNKQFIDIEYKDISDLTNYLAMDRSSGRVVDIEILDEKLKKEYDFVEDLYMITDTIMVRFK